MSHAMGRCPYFCILCIPSYATDTRPFDRKVTVHSFRDSSSRMSLTRMPSELVREGAGQKVLIVASVSIR